MAREYDPSATFPGHRSDGKFHVVVTERGGGRAGYLVRTWFAGDSRSSEAHARLDDARQAGEATWRSYLSGYIEAPDVPPESWGELTGRFCDREGLRPATQRTYRRALMLTDAVLGKRSLRSLGKTDVLAYMAQLAREHDGREACAVESRRSYLRTIRACVRWAVEEGWMTADITAGIEVEGPRSDVRPWLGMEDWPAFLAACATDGSRIRFGFILETGLRTAELIAARWAWMHSTIGRPTIRIAADSTTGFVPKWGRARAVPLTAKAQELLEEARQLWPGSNWIFQDDAAPLHAPKWARDVAKVCATAKVIHTDVHGLRRSAGARWLQDGIPLHIVSRLLGHGDIHTTMRWYGGIGDGHLASMIAGLDEVRPSNVVGIHSRTRGET